MAVKQGDRFKTKDKGSIIEIEAILDGCVYYVHRFNKNYREVSERSKMRVDFFEQLQSNGYLTKL